MNWSFMACSVSWASGTAIKLSNELIGSWTKLAAVLSGSVGETRGGQQRVSGVWVKITSSILAVAAVLAVIAYQAIPKGDLLAATASIDTMIPASLEEVDRTYRVHVVEEFTPGELKSATPVEGQRRQETVDDATLVVRGLDKFVLLHSPISGLGRYSGCDGQQSWSFRDGSPGSCHS